MIVAAVIAGFGALLYAERRRALRPATEPGGDRMARTMAMAGVSALAVQVAERPVVWPLARRVDARRAGILYRLQEWLGMPAWLRDALAVVLMDYTLYWWHVLLHRAPLLYRFHVVHHADLDLDATTALRFHFGELVASVPWRAAQILVIGVSPRALAIWQRLLLLSVVFHHSNLRLPIGVERRLGRLVMTPRLHGIHHSVVEEEQDSNWSSGLTLWDRLHGTYRANVPQSEVTIGVPAYRDPEDVALPEIIAMPFVRGAPEWAFPDGTRPERTPPPVPRDHLLP